MDRREQACYPEEELLMHLLNDESPDEAIKISNHLAACPSCNAIFSELEDAAKAIRSWTVEELPAESWGSMKIQIMQRIHQDSLLPRGRGLLGSMINIFQSAWDYAIKSPIPAICFIGVVIAFASERTIEFFRLQPVLPSAGQVIEMLRKVL